MPYVNINGNQYRTQGVYLDLNFKNIKEISQIKGLEKLNHLEALNLRNNRIEEIKGLDKLTNLKRLYLNGNKICEIKGLEYLNKLEILQLANNQITEIKGLDKLVNLKTLHLNNNRIKKIKGLENLKNLAFLELTENQITKIEGLDTLYKLDSINLNGNQIEDPDEEYLVQKTNNAQEFVEKCKFNKIGQKIPFIKFDSSKTFRDNINSFKIKHENVEDISLFVNIGTHKESKHFKGEQNAVFFSKRPEEIKLYEKDKTNFKDIIIHLVQLHSLKGIELKKKTKITHFNFFIRNFWNEYEINNNNILKYDHECESRVTKKIEEMLKLSSYNKLSTIQNKPDIIIFPENSIPANMIEDLIHFSKDNNLMIIGGVEHTKDNDNIINSAVIIDHGEIGRQRKQSPVWIWDKNRKEYIKENIKCEKIPEIKIFNTSTGRIALFICKDFLRLSEIIPYWVERNQVDFVIIPSLTTKVLPFQARLLSVLNYPQCKNTRFLFTNVGEYGGSELFSVSDNWRIEENFRKKNFDNLGEKIIIRKVERIKKRYLMLVLNEIDKFREIPEKLDKLNIYKKKIEKDHIPYTITRNLSITWKDGNPYVAETFKIPASDLFGKKLYGYCIRCKTKIPYNKYNPFCYDDWQEWKRWNNSYYEENFCHMCGKLYSGTFKKPLCDECYQS